MDDLEARFFVGEQLIDLGQCGGALDDMLLQLRGKAMNLVEEPHVANRLRREAGEGKDKLRILFAVCFVRRAAHAEQADHFVVQQQRRADPAADLIAVAHWNDRGDRLSSVGHERLTSLDDAGDRRIVGQIEAHSLDPQAHRLGKTARGGDLKSIGAAKHKRGGIIGHDAPQLVEDQRRDLVGCEHAGQQVGDVVQQGIGGAASRLLAEAPQHRLGECRPAGLHQLGQRRIEADAAGVGAGQPALDFGQLDFVQQPAVAAAEPRPLDGVGLQAAARLLGLAPLDQPALEHRPAADQRLVGQVYLVRVALGAVERQQAVIGQVAQRRLEERGVVVGRAQRGDRLLAAGIGAALAKLDQAQKDAAGDLSLRHRKVVQGRVGFGRQRYGQTAAPGAAHPLVGVERQDVVLHLGPQHHHRLLHQRQHAGLVGGVGQQALDQPGFEVDSDVGGGLLDGLTQRRAAQRRDLQALARNDRPEIGGHQIGVEIGAHRDQQRALFDHLQGPQVGDEARLLLAPGLGEEFLELVDHQEQPPGRGVCGEQVGERLSRLAKRAADRRGKRPAGLVAGTHLMHEPGIGRKIAALAQSRQQAGVDQRGLARPGWADDQQKAAVTQVLKHALDFDLAPVEEARVLGAEGDHAGVGTCDRSMRRRLMALTGVRHRRFLAYAALGGLMMIFDAALDLLFEIDQFVLDIFELGLDMRGTVYAKLCCFQLKFAESLGIDL